MENSVRELPEISEAQSEGNAGRFGRAGQPVFRIAGRPSRRPTSAEEVVRAGGRRDRRADARMVAVVAGKTRRTADRRRNRLQRSGREHEEGQRGEYRAEIQTGRCGRRP